VNLGGAVRVARAVVPHLPEGGAIVNIGSLSAISGGVGDVAVYGGSKAGVVGLTIGLACELGPQGIRVNVVAPGLTDTDATAHQPAAMKEASARMTPLGRNGLPEDVAGAVLMVASDAGRFLSGVYVPVSGGTLML
jgi:3-oxoacyl-[acyl-carrier protein] reductase